MHILVSNDDGIDSVGIRTLTQAVKDFGNVTVIAPAVNQSSTGHKRTFHTPLRIIPVANYMEGVQAFMIDGSPADCTAVARLGFIKEPIDLVVSGINHGANLAQDVTYSGTVAVTLEAAIFNIPAIAFSLAIHKETGNFEACIPYARQITQRVIEAKLPPKTLLNVNFPNIPIQGWKITRQGVREYRGALVERIDPRGIPYYWTAGEVPAGDVESVDTDLWAVHNGFVSVTPIHLDMTAHAVLPYLQDWNLNA